jgi:hypothetical protein
VARYPGSRRESRAAGRGDGSHLGYLLKPVVADLKNELISVA